MSTTTNISQHLTFALSDERFAIDIMQVQEVLEYLKITKIPGTPSFIKGVINVRGYMVTVIDLKEKFLNQEIVNDVNTCIIILEAIINGESITLGILVDSVSEVVDFNTDEIELPPKLGTSINTKYIRGIAKQDDEFIILLNIEKVFNEEELSLITDSAPEKVGDTDE